MIYKRHYLPLVTAAITSVLIFGMVSAGTFIGWLPLPGYLQQSALARLLAPGDDGSQAVATVCADCGVIESIEVTYSPVGSSPAGRDLAEYRGGDGVQWRRVFRVTVRMNDGGRRIIHRTRQRLAVGQKVQVTDSGLLLINDNL